MDYWAECISEAFDDAGIVATDEQIQTVTAWVEGAAENQSLACGYEAIPNPIKLENDRLQAELEKERNKKICPMCKGSGVRVTHGPVHSGISDCLNCRGSGFIY